MTLVGISLVIGLVGALAATRFWGASFTASGRLIRLLLSEWRWSSS